MNNCCKNDRRLFENVDTETVLLLSKVASSSLWPSLSSLFLISFVSDKSSPLFMICDPGNNYHFLSDTVIFYFQSKRNCCKYSKITHLQPLILVTFAS